MITMGSAPIPLPYKSWDEVQPDQLQTIQSINVTPTEPNTDTAIASGRNWKNKTFVGIKLGSIVTIILIVLRIFAAAGRTSHHREYGTNTLPNFSVDPLATQHSNAIRLKSIRDRELESELLNKMKSRFGQNRQFY